MGRGSAGRAEPAGEAAAKPEFDWLLWVAGGRADKKTAPCSLGLSWMLLRTRTLNFSQDCCRRRCPRALFPIVEANGREREVKKEKRHAVERERDAMKRGPHSISFSELRGTSSEILLSRTFGCVGKFPKRPLARSLLLLALKVLSAGGREGGREAAELFPAAKAAWALHWVEINSVDGRRF